MNRPALIQRPQRWDSPFDEGMTERDVQWLLDQIEPFKSMDQAAFSKSVPLRGILRFDCRLVRLEPGQIIVREGDYGSSAFLVLSGQAIVSLKSLPPRLLGRRIPKRTGWLRALAQLWRNDRHPEVRRYDQPPVAAPGDSPHQRGPSLFLQDVPGVIGPDGGLTLGPGEFFGELSALTRTPRTATVVAADEMVVLEIRWQGFRDLMKRQSAMRQHIEQLYRENSLRTHLRETPLLAGLPGEVVEQLAEATRFESYGSFDWHHPYRSTRQQDVAEKIQAEPVIATEGDYVDGLILIRNGFARLSRRHGAGHQTVAYLGKGQPFGWRELVHNWRTGEQRPYLLSLRAIGHVDLLRLPTELIERLVLPHLAPERMPQPMPPAERVDRSLATPARDRRMARREPTMDRGLMEFLVEHRMINGTRAMMIDLDRCTRCDDCVRACATAHNNNPRFIRQGIRHDRWMVAHACMHCLDPVCMIGCPTGAIGRESVTGAVTINDATCIGCGTCESSCPYQNIQLVHVTDPSGVPYHDQQSGDPIRKATKCDFCSDQPGGPACQRACPHDALIRIDLSRPKTVQEWTE